MDAATLYMLLEIKGRDREEYPREFPTVAACEAYVSDFKKRLSQTTVPSSIKSYECMRWYADDTLILAD